MPGFFGGVGEVTHAIQRLSDRFREIWQPVEEISVESGWLGGHSFGGDRISGGNGKAVAWDGDCGAPGDSPVGPTPGAPGVSAEIDGRRSHAVLQSDPSGAFPLFYHVSHRGIVFSTHLKPLASAVAAAPNLVGVSQYLRFGYIHSGETLFQGIRRLQPGQRLTWSAERGSTVEETSRLWANTHDFASPDEAAEEIAPLLRARMDQILGSGSTGVLMMSAGWDSRTLLAAAREFEDAGLSAFSHGDTGSRELRIASRICQRLGVPWHGESIDAAVWDLDHLEACFKRTESLVFPHWARAGTLLEGRTSQAFSGVLGEVLGGHYGQTHVSSGLLGKGASLLRSLRTVEDRQESVVDGSELEAVRDRLRLSGLPRPWYLNRGVEEDRHDAMAQINERIDRDLTRLEDRGVASSNLLLEAAITETRAVQYICAQPLSMRQGVDITMPFAHRKLLEIASRIPPALKVHNRVNRLLVRRLRPELERFPMAATLVPASWPLLLQEGSRAVRRVLGESAWVLHRATRGRFPHPRLGWVNFDFLRTPGLLEEVFNSLSLDIWDRDAFDTVAKRVRNGADFGSLHPLYDQTGKVLTVDRMLRNE